MSEILWASYHLSEDEKEMHEWVKNNTELILSFVNPQMFKEYYRRTSATVYENESFDDEMKEKLGMSRDQMYDVAKGVDERMASETYTEPDIVGQPVIITNG